MPLITRDVVFGSQQCTLSDAKFSQSGNAQEAQVSWKALGGHPCELLMGRMADIVASWHTCI